MNLDSEGLWLEKKSQSNQGRGIKLISDVAKYKEELMIKKDVDSFGHMDDAVDSTALLMKKIEKMEQEGQEITKTDAEEDKKEEVKPEEANVEEAKKEEEK